MSGEDDVTSPSAPKKPGGVKALLAQLEQKNKEAEAHSTPTKGKTPGASPAGSFKFRTPSTPGPAHPTSASGRTTPNPDNAAASDTVAAQAVAQPDSGAKPPSDNAGGPGQGGNSNGLRSGTPDSQAQRRPSGATPDLSAQAPRSNQSSRRPSGAAQGGPPPPVPSQAPTPPQHPPQQGAQPGRNPGAQPPMPPANTDRQVPNALFNQGRGPPPGMPQGRPPMPQPQPNAARSPAVGAPPSPSPANDEQLLSDYPPTQSPSDVERQWKSDVESRWKLEADRHKQAAHQFAQVAKQARTDAERARDALEASERRLQLVEAERRRDQEDHKRETESLKAEVQGFRALRDTNIGDNVEVQTKIQELERNVTELNAQQHEMLQELRMRDEAIDEYRLQIQTRHASETALRADVEQQLIHLQSAYLNEQAGRKAAEAEIAKLLHERDNGPSAVQEKEREILKLREELMKAKAEAPLPPQPTSVIEADLRRLQTILDMKSEEMNRLKKQFEAVSKERDDLKAPMNGVNAGGVPLQMPPPDHTVNQLDSLTEEKDKTIADLLVLQDDMVKELHSMREDLASLAQRNSIVEEEREYLSQQLNAMYSQQQQQQPPQQAPADRGEQEERERLRQMEEAERKERFMEQSRQQMEEALQNARAEMVGAMQAAQAERDALLRAAQEEREALLAQAQRDREALAQESEAERSQLLARLASARGLEKEVEELRQERERERARAEQAKAESSPDALQRELAQAKQAQERLTRMLAEQGKGLIQMQKSQDNARLAELREQVLNLDRKHDPSEAVRALQKLIVEQKHEEEGKKKKEPGSATSSRPESPNDVPMPFRGGAERLPSNVRAATPLRASMPEPSLREALFADSNAAVPVPETRAARSPVLSSSGPATPQREMMSPTDFAERRKDPQVARLVRSVSPGSSFSSDSPQRVTAPPPEIPEDILRYQPPSTKEQRDKLTSPELVAPRVSPTTQSTPTRAAPPPVLASPARAPVEHDLSPMPKGLTPSEYVALRAKKGQGQGVVRNSSPSVVRHASPATTPSQLSSLGARISASALVDAGRVQDDEEKFSPERLDRFAKYQDQLMSEGAGQPQAEQPAQQEEWEVGLGQVELTPDGAIMPVVRGPTMLPGIVEEDQNDPRRWSRESKDDKGAAGGAEVVVDEDEDEETSQEEEDEDHDYDVEEYDPVKEESDRVKLPPPKGLQRFGV